ncbi:MAG: hypothetical protein H6569_01565 [Lewinellaceae bacterium]|nr:hypothetical protein [Lewinellaceae bacterium]
MYKVKFGGKKGKTIKLVESPDMVAIRTKGNKEINKVTLNRGSREIIDETTSSISRYHQQCRVGFTRTLNPLAVPASAMLTRVGAQTG